MIRKINYADKSVGGKFTASDANEIKTSINSNADVLSENSQLILSLQGGSLGSIKPTDAAPTPTRNGNYTFSIGGNKPEWLTAEAGITEVKAGDGVAVVYDGVSAYTYTHVKIDRIADIYNVTVEIPLADGQYYTPTTARAAVPAINRAKGKELTYETSAGVWVNEKFVGSDVANWAVDIYWKSEIKSGHGKNFIDISKVKLNTYINGPLAPSYNAGYKSSDYIEVTPDTFYFLSGMLFENQYLGVAYFDLTKTWISSTVLYKETCVLFTPANCAFVMVTFGSDANFELIKNTVMLELGIVKTAYEPYFTTVDYYLESHQTENLYNGEVLADLQMNTGNGAISTVSGYSVTNFIPVKPNTTYNVKTFGSFAVSFSTNTKMGSSLGKAATLGNFTITTGATTTFIALGNALSNDSEQIANLQKTIISELSIDDSMTYNPVKSSIFNATKKIVEAQQDNLLKSSVLASDVINLFDKNTYLENQGLNSNNGYWSSYPGGRVSNYIPVTPGEIYTIIGFPSTTQYTGFGFTDLSKGQIGNSGMTLAVPSSGDLVFQEKNLESPLTFTLYGSTCYVKPPAGAAYMVIGIGMDVSSVGVYHGIYYQNPNKLFNTPNLLKLDGNLVLTEIAGSKKTVLMLGDSITDQSGQTEEPNTWVTYFKDLVGIHKIHNFAQGGARWIHEATTTDVASYSETYDNGSVKNVVSNQLRKYLFRYAEDPDNYPIPNAIIISCGINDSQYWDSGKFDSAEYDTVFAKTFLYANLDQTKIAGAFRRVIEDIRIAFGDVPIFIDLPMINANSNTLYPYNIGRALDQLATKTSCHVIDSMKDSGVNFMLDSVNSDPISHDFRDGVHPTPTGAVKKAKNIARWYKFYME